LEEKSETGFRDPYGFTGKELEVDLGIMYFGARWYNPQLGRWLSPDPLYLVSTAKNAEKDQNIYHYAGNNPWKFIDPDGTTTTDEGCSKDKKSEPPKSGVVTEDTTPIINPKESQNVDKFLERISITKGISTFGTRKYSVKDKKNQIKKVKKMKDSAQKAMGLVGDTLELGPYKIKIPMSYLISVGIVESNATENNMTPYAPGGVIKERYYGYTQISVNQLKLSMSQNANLDAYVKNWIRNNKGKTINDAVKNGVINYAAFIVTLRYEIVSTIKTYITNNQVARIFSNHFKDGNSKSVLFILAVKHNSPHEGQKRALNNSEFMSKPNTFAGERYEKDWFSYKNKIRNMMSLWEKLVDND
ncbi:RHS repeat-associated core domain-containing protein, partial [Myxococcota bacterium]|nr:RHS repeat-associated core domain-containing protein [Myxococcota bacterium]